MNTLLTKSSKKAAEILLGGGIVAFPTETVYGLGANIFDIKAIESVFYAKSRPGDNPLIAHVKSQLQIDLVAAEINSFAKKFFREFFPGPLTIVLPKAEKVPKAATAGLETIGVRMPRNELAGEFLQDCGTPIVAPSANLSGKPSPTTWEAVYEDLNGRIDCILQGEVSEIGLESTVVDCTGEFPVLLRSGAVSIAELRTIVPETKVLNYDESDQPRSPGLKHKHYAPTAKVLIFDPLSSEIENTENSAFIGLDKPPMEFKITEICETKDDYAHSIFSFFRRCDTEKIEKIYCQSVTEKGIGTALMDRIKRASES